MGEVEIRVDWSSQVMIKLRLSKAIAAIIAMNEPERKDRV